MFITSHKSHNNRQTIMCNSYSSIDVDVKNIYIYYAIIYSCTESTLGVRCTSAEANWHLCRHQSTSCSSNNQHLVSGPTLQTMAPVSPPASSFRSFKLLMQVYLGWLAQPKHLVRLMKIWFYIGVSWKPGASHTDDKGCLRASLF